MGDEEGIYVVLDTNALLLPFTEGTRLEDELERLVGLYRMVVPSSIMQEVNGLALSGTNKAARAAKAAGIFLKRCRIEATGLPGDDGVLEVARRLKAMVVTNDAKVRKEAQRSGLDVISSRGKGRLAIS